MNFWVPNDQPPIARRTCNRILLKSSIKAFESSFYLQARVDFLEGEDSLVKSDLSVLWLIVALETAELSFLQPAEGEDDVSAKISRDVFWQKLSDLHTVLRPIGVVAHDLHSVFVFLAALFC